MHPRPDGARQGVHDHVHHGRQADQEQRTVEADVGERAVDVEAKRVDASNLDSASIAVKRARINCGGEPRRRSNTSSGVNQAITNLEDISAQPCRQDRRDGLVVPTTALPGGITHPRARVWFALPPGMLGSFRTIDARSGNITELFLV
jgi:hypothetical protein